MYPQGGGAGSLSIAFLCECCEVAHECDSVMASLRQLHCRNSEGAPT